MSFGFLALNNANQVLVSSETRNLHFIGKAGLAGIRSSFDTHGGMRLLVYTINSPVPPVPFFTIPTGEYVGVTSLRDMGGGNWELELLRSGTSGVWPEVYCFADPRARTPTGSAHGMLVLRGDGSPSFDSRLKPLAVAGGTSVAPNPDPLGRGIPYMSPRYCESSGASSGNFAPATFIDYGLGYSPVKPIFNFSSVAQAQRQAEFSARDRDCLGIGAYGACIGYGTEEVWISRYWAFYRTGITRIPGGVRCGWTTLNFSCNRYYYKDRDFIGIDVGGGSGTGGSWPYTNETLNTGPRPVLVANGERYD